MKNRTCFVSNSSSSSFIVSIDRPAGIADKDAVKIDEFKDRLSDIDNALKRWPNDNEYLEERKELQDKLKEYQDYAESSNAYVFDLHIQYGAEDVIDQLRNVLPGFHVLDSEEE